MENKKYREMHRRKELEEYLEEKSPEERRELARKIRVKEFWEI